MTVTPTEALMRQRASRPESTAFIFQEDAWAYRRLADESERVARGISSQRALGNRRSADLAIGTSAWPPLYLRATR